jgi:GNAT superfamily N-acetyltransferase
VAEPPRPAIEIRPAHADDLLDCAHIWRDSINDYTNRLNQLPIPDDLSRVLIRYRHLLDTDPEGFVVAAPAAVDGAGRQPPLGFGSAIVRDQLWFLSLLFVRPEAQGQQLGRRILEHLLPPAGVGLPRSIATDAAQPISNGL